MEYNRFTGQLIHRVCFVRYFADEYAAMQQLTGGVHLKTNIRCVIYSTVIFTVISLLDPGKGGAIMNLLANLLTSFVILTVGSNYFVALYKADSPAGLLNKNKKAGCFP